MEDLWAFNSELVAHAIYRSEIPVISAVGHEPDVTISDYVADLRAATPSNAAELAVLDQDALRQSLDSILATMTSGIQHLLNNAMDRLLSLTDRPALQNYDLYLQNKHFALEQLQKALVFAQNQNISEANRDFIAFTAKLDALSPLKVLSRGYAMVKTEGDCLVRAANQLKIDDRVEIVFNDGNVTANVTGVEERSL